MSFLLKGIKGVSGALGFKKARKANDKGAVDVASTSARTDGAGPLLQSDASDSFASGIQQRHAESPLRAGTSKVATGSPAPQASSASPAPASASAGLDSSRASSDKQSAVDRETVEKWQEECQAMEASIQVVCQEHQSLQLALERERESEAAACRSLLEEQAQSANTEAQFQMLHETSTNYSAEAFQCFQRLHQESSLALDDYNGVYARAENLASEIGAWKKVEEHTRHSLRSELDACKVAARKAGEQRIAEQHACDKATTAIEALEAELTSRRSAEAQSVAEKNELAEVLSEMRSRNQRLQDAYWDDAPFLSIADGEAHRLQREVSEQKAAATELQAALESLGSLPREHDDLSKARRAALSPTMDAFHADDNDATNSRLAPQPATPPRRLAPAPRSVGTVAAMPLPPATHIAALPPPPSPVSNARAALEAENERLRGNVSELRERYAELQSSLTSPSGGDAGPLPPIIDDEDSRTSERSSDAFSTAVAGTGARVVEWMKQALQEDVIVLRSLQSEKQHLDDEFSKERRLRAALARRLGIGAVDYDEDSSNG